MILNFRNYIKNLLLNYGAIVNRNDNSKVIYYHDVHGLSSYTDMSTPMNLFEKHFMVIKALAYQVVNQITEDQKQLMIVFDDGFRGLYENFDFFLKHNIPVTVCIVSKFIGKKNYMNEQEIKELLNTGLLNIQSHTYSHKDLSILDQDELIFELLESKKHLEEIFSVNIDEICFPMGYFNQNVISAAMKIGYKRLFTSIPGDFCDCNHLVCRNLVQFSSSSQLKSILLGGMGIFADRYKRQHIKL